MKEVRLYLPDDVKEVVYWDSEFGKLAKQPVQTGDVIMMGKVVQKFIEHEFPTFEEKAKEVMKDVNYFGKSFSPNKIVTTISFDGAEQ